MWYGVYRSEDRTLTFGSAGHGPAFLVPADKSDTVPLGVPALMIGLLPTQSYDVQHATVPEDSTLFLFSDGAYEIVTKTDERWELSNFLPLLKEASVPGTPEPDRVYQAVKKAAALGPLEDDFSLVAVTFP
jgi:sigma-B regulation protein RsbU (phosphoserine phosphatase)